MHFVLRGLVVVGAAVFVLFPAQLSETPQHTSVEAQVSHQQFTAKLSPRTPSFFRLNNIKAQVSPITVVNGSLTPPSNPLKLGWWGSKLGSSRGVALITGHASQRSPAAFNRLSETQLGSIAVVSGFKYRVVSTRTYSKSEFARKSGSLLDQHGKHRLVLVTCSDYVRSSNMYLSNFVVVLELV